MQEKLFNLLFDQDEITWQTMIYELVKKEEMNPWDIDISLLAERFLEMLKEFKRMDFRVSGKILLAAAILLRIKSDRLVGDDLTKLNSLIAMSEEEEESFYDALMDDIDYDDTGSGERQFRLIPKTPQPRKRKVSVYDLVDALHKALEVKNRRVKFTPPDTKVEIPKKTVDISILIRDIYDQIKKFFVSNGIKKLTFSNLVPSKDKDDKIYTFIPLLHLDNQRKIEVNQQEHLGEIDISLNKNYKPESVPEQKDAGKRGKAANQAVS